MVKVGFVGAGRIGATTAFASLSLLEPAEMAIVDIAKDPAEGEAMDLSAAAVGFGRRTRIKGGDDYALLKGSDVVVVSAGFARKPGMTRLDLLEKNIKVVKDIAGKLKAATPNAKVILVTNPVDVLLYNFWRELGFPRQRVFGMGSSHDTVRINDILLEAGARHADAHIIGEHGDTMFPVPSQSKVDGLKPDWADLEKKVRERAINVIAKKGATVFAPAVCTAQLVAAVALDKRQQILTSCVLDGEYGLKGVALGVPAIIGRNGVEKIVEWKLSPEEKAKLDASAKAMKEKIEEAKKFLVAPAA